MKCSWILKHQIGVSASHCAALKKMHVLPETDCGEEGLEVVKSFFT